MSWSPGYYCVVNYTVTVLSSTNNTDQYNTSDNTTSIVINFITGVQYSFIVIARDNVGRVGPLSQLLNYTWDGKSNRCFYVKLLFIKYHYKLWILCWFKFHIMIL